VAVAPVTATCASAHHAQLTKMLEVPVCFLPACVLRWRVLEPMLFQSKGTVGV
jgi:hypothetical protein